MHLRNKIVDKPKNNKYFTIMNLILKKKLFLVLNDSKLNIFGILRKTPNKTSLLENCDGHC